ncbi:MAG: hypothetical protein IT456_19340 [Planctomycetes bacterium]|nr:hypothetical protein [Planctomycetota bacterium]
MVLCLPICPQIHPKCALRVLLPLFAALPAIAQWRQIAVTSAPPVRSGFSLVPDPNGGVLLFGGDANNPAATEWHWSGTEWASVTTPVPRRDGQAAAVHGPSGAVYVFGGVGPGTTLLNDLWRLDGAGWSLVAPPHSPPWLRQMTMAYDARTDAMVLVGRNGTQFETWSFRAGDWALEPQGALPGTGDVQLFADTVRGEVGAFSLESNSLVVHLFHEGAWHAVASAPGITGAGAAAFDSQRGRAVWFAHAVGRPADTFEWDGLRLRPVGTAAAPGVILPGQLAMVQDAARSEVLMVTSVFQVEAWSWAPQPVPLASSYGTPCVDPQLRLALVPGDVPQPGARHRLQVQGNAASQLAFSLIGLSHVTDGGPLPRPFPVGVTTCLQRVPAYAPLFLGVGLPVSLQITVPNSATFLGFRYDAQVVLADGTGVTDATNGLEIQVGLPIAEQAITETFANASLRDAQASGDVWAGGTAQPVAIGGDGRHGSFDATIGVPGNANEYVWNTDSVTVPGSQTLSGMPEVVTDGKFYFTDFVLPAGVTVDFTGSAPPQIFVRGRCEVAGTLRCNGAAMTTFNGRGAVSNPQPFVAGQPGGLPGAGGGQGGKGGNECAGTGPQTQVINGVTVFVNNGQDGEDVRLLAGHAYAANAAGTGGRGSSMNPANGLVPPSSAATSLSGIYNPFFAAPGAGGGMSQAGAVATVNLFNLLQVNAIPPAGVQFSLFPYPPVSAPAGYSSLNHFLVGGSGGGGGATHAYGTFNIAGATFDRYIAGAAGSGGGGALALRAGGDLTVTATASLQAKGGAGVLIRGHDSNATTNVNWGVTCPGGGGSGGSVLLQSGGQATVQGAIDTSGGGGSRTGQIFVASFNVTSQAGAGSPGFFRVEGANGTNVTGTTIPALQLGSNTGPLTDTDARTGSRSVWIIPPTTELPRYVRYELLVDIAGSSVLFSDDPAVSGLAANDPNGPVMLRVQGAKVDPITGFVQASTQGPWRTSVAAGGADSLNQDRAEALRFDLVLDKNLGVSAVRELRIVWR